MAYEKIVFKNGDVLTGDHMNHIEEGIFNASNEATEEDIINLFLNIDTLPVVVDMDGNILTDENNSILLI